MDTIFAFSNPLLTVLRDNAFHEFFVQPINCCRVGAFILNGSVEVEARSCFNMFSTQFFRILSFNGLFHEISAGWHANVLVKSYSLACFLYSK